MKIVVADILEDSVVERRNSGSINMWRIKKYVENKRSLKVCGHEEQEMVIWERKTCVFSYVESKFQKQMDMLETKAEGHKGKGGRRMEVMGEERI